MTMLSEALQLLRRNQHGYVWLEGHPKSEWDLAQELVDAGYAGWGSYEGREDSRGVYVTNRGFDWLKSTVGEPYRP